MIDDLSEHAKEFLLLARSLRPRDVRLDRTLIPAEAGIYGWWFEAPFLNHQAGGTLNREAHHLLYVGIAPNRPAGLQTKPRTLRDRLGDHLRGPVATSTLRRSLAGLLSEELDLTCRRTLSGKVRMRKGDEERLTTWIEEHAMVTWLATPEPWTLEKELFESGPRLPLNISGTYNPFAYYLKALRSCMGTDKPRPGPYRNRLLAKHRTSS